MDIDDKPTIEQNFDGTNNMYQERNGGGMFSSTDDMMDVGPQSFTNNVPQNDTSKNIEDTTDNVETDNVEETSED